MVKTQPVTTQRWRQIILFFVLMFLELSLAGGVVSLAVTGDADLFITVAVCVGVVMAAFLLLTPDWFKY